MKLNRHLKFAGSLKKKNKHTTVSSVEQDQYCISQILKCLNVCFGPHSKYTFLKTMYTYGDATVGHTKNWPCTTQHKINKVINLQNIFNKGWTLILNFQKRCYKLFNSINYSGSLLLLWLLCQLEDSEALATGSGQNEKQDCSYKLRTVDQRLTIQLLFVCLSLHIRPRHLLLSDCQQIELV